MKEFRPDEEMYLNDGCDIFNAIIESADISTEDGPRFNGNFSEFEWNGIVYKIPQKYNGMPVNVETMKKIATEIIEEQEILARIAQAELDIYERFEQNDDDFLNDA